MTLATVIEMVTLNIGQSFQFGIKSVSFTPDTITITGDYQPMMENVLPARAKEALKLHYQGFSDNIYLAELATGDEGFQKVRFFLNEQLH